MAFRRGLIVVLVERLSVLGGLDILVNNAGAARPYLAGSAAIPDQEWQDSGETGSRFSRTPSAVHGGFAITR
jgi:NAD(P)-dependent dehydrogenase (short-subunit alcohol dehydrogenase family)